MKRIDFALIIACIAMMVACGDKKHNYVISGVVPAGVEDGEIVNMTDYNEGIVINTAVVSRNKFVIKGVVDSPMAIMLTIQDMQADLILDKGELTVDMSDPYGGKGNLLTEKLYAFYTECGGAILQLREQIADMDESLTEEEASQIQDDIFEELFIRLDEIAISYLEDHSNDALGAMVFYIWMQNQMEPSVEKFQEASRFVGDYVLNFGPVNQMMEYYGKIFETAVGRPFVDFTIANGNIDGTAASLSDYVGKGKYVLVDFWASWCVPCRMETPIIAEVYNKYKGERFEVLGVAVMDRRDESLKALEEDGSTWPQILDAQMIPTEMYGIQGIPHIILFGPDGVIIARNLRGDNLKEKIAEVMQ